MKWFKGSVVEAIQTSKAKKSVFIVYVHGDDEMSEKMSNVMDDGAITETCRQGDCVAIKLNVNSSDGKFFSQIYPVLIVPSTYFIGDNGVPLEVLAGAVEPEALNQTIQNVIKLHSDNVPKTNNPLQNDPETTDIQPANQSSAHETTFVPESPEVSMDQSEIPGASSDTNIIGKTPPPSKEEKLEKVNKFIEQKREEKMIKEQDDEKSREQQRRDLGRGVTKLKQMQNESKAKETMDQIRKDKEEEKKARERIKEEIERDRRERSAKFKREKEDRDRGAEEAKRAKLEATQQQLAEEAARRSETARIQFRLSDGTCILQNFPSDETFQAVQDFITQTVGSPVRLSTIFPKRIFTPDDYSSTLTSLQLAPSASVVVLPGTDRGAVLTQGGSNTGGTLGMFNTLVISPLLAAWNFLYGLLFGSKKPQEASNGDQASSSQPSSSSGFNRRSDRPTTAYKRRTQNTDFTDQGGNVRKFRNNQDDDDDNATWNGNSTQQM